MGFCQHQRSRVTVWLLVEKKCEACGISVLSLHVRSNWSKSAFLLLGQTLLFPVTPSWLNSLNSLSTLLLHPLHWPVRSWYCCKGTPTNVQNHDDTASPELHARAGPALQWPGHHSTQPGLKPLPLLFPQRGTEPPTHARLAEWLPSCIQLVLSGVLFCELDQLYTNYHSHLFTYVLPLSHLPESNILFFYIPPRTIKYHPNILSEIHISVSECVCLCVSVCLCVCVCACGWPTRGLCPSASPTYCWTYGFV